MARSKMIASIAAWLIACSLSGAVTATVSLSREAGDRFQGKIDAIAKNGANDPAASKETAISETELNSYLVYHLREKIPQALTNPGVTLIGEGRLAGRVFVDLDEFKRQRGTGGVMDPFSYLSGRVPVTASGILRTQQGRGQFHLQTAEIRGVPLPKPILQELVSFFTRSQRTPNGVDIDAPFDLPAKIREIAINRAEATVIQ